MERYDYPEQHDTGEFSADESQQIIRSAMARRRGGRERKVQEAADEAAAKERVLAERRQTIARFIPALLKKLNPAKAKRLYVKREGNEAGSTWYESLGMAWLIAPEHPVGGNDVLDRLGTGLVLLSNGQLVQYMDTLSSTDTEYPDSYVVGSVRFLGVDPSGDWQAPDARLSSPSYYRDYEAGGLEIQLREVITKALVPGA